MQDLTFKPMSLFIDWLTTRLAVIEDFNLQILFATETLDMQLFKGSDQSISCTAKGESNWWNGKKEPLPFDLTRQIYHHQMEMKKQIT